MATIEQAKANIYDRLASAPAHHPASASLFSDWSIQSGDIITVNSGSESYTVPIYGERISWKGKTRVSVESSGNQQRPPLEQMAQQQEHGYGGGGGIRSGGGYGGGRTQRKKQDFVRFIVGIDENGKFYVNNPGYITLAINEENQSVAHINADHLIFTSTQSVQDVCGDWEWENYTEDGVKKKRIVLKNGTGIFKDRNGTAMVVYDDGNLTGQITVRKINGQTGTIATIDADKIKIGTRGQSTITLNDTFTVYSNGGIYSPQSIHIDSTISCVDHLYIAKSSVGSLNVTDLAYAVYDVRITPDGNTYKLEKQYCNPSDLDWHVAGTFSRAVSSFTSSWANGVCTVTANPQRQTAEIKLSGISGSNNITSNGTYTYKVMYEDSNGNDQETGLTKQVVVDVPSGGGTVTIGGIDKGDTTRPLSGYEKANTISNYVQAGHKYVYFRVFLDGTVARSFYIETK